LGTGRRWPQGPVPEKQRRYERLRSAGRLAPDDDNPANHEQGSGRPDPANPGPVGRRSAIEPTDWHQIAEDRFAKEVAGILGKAHADGAFEEVVIAAPPAVMSELRDHLSANVAGAVIAEIAKTLTDHPIDMIEMILKADLDAL
jgi:protein required for attachment to host cells